MQEHNLKGAKSFRLGRNRSHIHLRSAITALVCTCRDSTPCRGCGSCVCSGMFNSFPPYVMLLARLLCPWDSPVKNTGVGYHFLLQGLVLTQGFNLCLLALAGGLFTTELPGKPLDVAHTCWRGDV